jgi:outer membrane protein OmpA-like peptidoglycan-associated protein
MIRPSARVLFPAALGLAVASGVEWPSPAHAQVAGFALDQFNPSDRGSDWFALDSLDLRGTVREAVGVVGDFAYLPLAIYNPDGTIRTKLVAEQVFVHVGASMVFVDRLRIGLNLPVAVYENGDSGTLGGVRYSAPGSFSVGDLRASADLRLAGRYGDPFRLGVGIQVFAPIGSRSNFTGDDRIRILPHLNVAGDAGVFAYAVQAGFQYRVLDDAYAGTSLGSQITFGASVGLQTLDKVVLVGPEVYGATTVTKGDQIFKTLATPLEGILGAHFKIASSVRLAVGGGGGLTRGLGAPAARALATIEWAPDVPKPPPPDRDNDGITDADDACPDAAGPRTDDPKTNGCPPDRDRDGIIDAEDACPEIPGVKTDDPKTNGCPPDKDGDGVFDAEDACPDVPGVKTDDPKTNGCPPDKDGDGIIDANDACPDVPGVKTDDPKTNGCPPDPDRDKDGIPNDQDACPDEAGPKNADPKKNGCPQAVVKNDRIVILEQVRFKTDSAVILPDSDSLLQAVLKVFNDHTEIVKVSIEGHTDNRGAAAHNKGLSERRAASVVDWLVKHGVDRGRLTSVGYGMERPIDTNDTDQGRQNNRRVEFHIVEPAAK